VRTLVFLSEEGVDRKLNVALTLAREQVVVLGKEELLATQAVYQRFVDFCKRRDLLSKLPASQTGLLPRSERLCSSNKTLNLMEHLQKIRTVATM
jgi:superfamily I DNA and/or RNA helicase